MRRDDAVYLRHILDAASLIGTYTAGLDEVAFAANSLVWMVWCGSLRSRRPEVPWHVAAAMRDKLIHDYMGVEPAIVWQTATVSLPDFADQIRAVLRTIDPHQ